MATVDANSELGQQIVADAKQYVLHSWSVQDAVNPIPVAGGEGRYFWDYDGKRYLDFASQLVNLALGHQHPKLIQAIKDQADKLCTIGPPMATRAALDARATARRGDARATWRWRSSRTAAPRRTRTRSSSRAGTPGRHKIDRALPLVPRSDRGRDQRSPATRAAGPSEPGIPGVVRMFDPYTYRCPVGHPDPCPVCTGAPHLEEILQYEGAQNVAAVIMETVTGTNGIIVPPDGYLQSIREVCDRHGIVLIFDEVMAGFGRTGKWFACENWDVVPDILTVAKGINSGYVPLGAMVISEKLRDWVRDKPFSGGLTYSGHPLACASGVASIEAYREEGIVENAAAHGRYLADALRALQDRHPSIGDVRGLGLFWGLELVRNRETREPLVPFNAAGEARCTDGPAGEGGARRGPLPLRPLERDHDRAAAEHDARRARRGARDPGRGARRRRRVRA